MKRLLKTVGPHVENIRRSGQRLILQLWFPEVFEEVIGDHICRPNLYTSVLLGEQLASKTDEWGSNPHARAVQSQCGSSETCILRVVSYSSTESNHAGAKSSVNCPTFTVHFMVDQRSGSLTGERIRNHQEFVGIVALSQFIPVDGAVIAVPEFVTSHCLRPKVLLRHAAPQRTGDLRSGRWLGRETGHNKRVPQAQEASVRTLLWKPACHENSMCKLLILVALQHRLSTLCDAAGLIS